MSQLPPQYRDFRAFLTDLWKYLGLPKPTRAQLEFALYLQHGPRRKVIKGFRGVGKSWITAAYVVWCLLGDPQLNFLIVSASKQRADNFSMFTQQIIMGWDVLEPLRPRDGQRFSKIEFDVGPAATDQNPSVKSAGITGQITGTRADEIIADDVEVPKNSQTHLMREKLLTQVAEFEAIIKPGGKITYLGTDQTEQSLYTKMRDKGYDIFIWPARYPTPDKIASYQGQLAPAILRRISADASLAGKSTDPERFTDLDLAEREASYGRSGFALQFMLDTSLSDADRYPLKLRDLMVIDVNPTLAPEYLVWAGDRHHQIDDLPAVGLQGDAFVRPMQISPDKWQPYTGAVMFIDPSGKGKDETGYAVTKMRNSLIYCPAAGGLMGGYSPETLQAIALMAKRHGVNEIVVEENFGNGMYAALLKPVVAKVHPCTVTEVHSVGQKELRIIDTLEPVLNQHRLVIDRKVIETDYKSSLEAGTNAATQYQLFHQMTRLTRERGALRHDDRIEALAGSVAYWTEQVSRDVKAAAEAAKQQRLDDELQSWQDYAFNREPSGASWAPARGRWGTRQ